jgi:hypothetical protein
MKSKPARCDAPLAKGQATVATDGRLFITEHGQWVWRQECIDSWS